MSSFRITVLAGLVLAMSGCVTPPPRYYESHQEVVYRDGHYYATGNDRDGDYYYGREQPRYRYYDSYDGYGSGYWGLGRYSCGYYGSCWPYYGSGYGGGYGYGGSYWPRSSFSLSLGHSWNYGSLAWTGYWGGYRPHSRYDYRRDYRRHDDRHDTRHDDRYDHRDDNRYDRHEGDRYDSRDERRHDPRYPNRPEAQPGSTPSPGRSEPPRYPARNERDVPTRYREPSFQRERNREDRPLGGGLLPSPVMGERERVLPREPMPQPRLGDHRQEREQAIREQRTLIEREPRPAPSMPSPRYERPEPMPRAERFERPEPMQRAERFERREQAQPQPRPMPIRAIQQRSDDDEREDGERSEGHDRR